MELLKLEKNIILYKSQFDQYLLGIRDVKQYELDRLSLELDGILFRINYMNKHPNIDNGNIIYKTILLRKDFTYKALELRRIFNLVIYNLICDGNKEYRQYVEDIMAQDVKIDQMYVKFKMIILSRNEEFINFIDSKFEDNKVFNIYPNQYFRFYTDSYNDAITKAYPELFECREQNEVGVGKDSDIFVHNFTFQTSEACNLNCTYCYQFNKTPMRMDFETAKEFIDNLLDDKYGYINRFNSPAIIIEFIGGEPFLEINLTRKIYEYFLDRCYELDHPWFTMHRLSICSNGLLYFQKEVQDFFKDYSQNISFNISIDGNKKLHDSCRIQPNKEGSYDIAMAALNHYNKHYNPERNSKMTLAPSNIMYLYDSVVDFIKNGMTSINLNCVFEEGWNQETARIEYYELKKLSDYIIDNDLDHIYIAIFNERQEYVHPKSFDGTSCGGTGSMLALRPNGQFYPCIRYMPTSVGDNVKDLCIGDVKNGIIGREQGSEILQMMDNVTRRSQTNDICYECPISNSCMNCSALSHTVFGTPNKRTTFICIQMIAEALANVYYWNRLLLKHPEYNLNVRKNVVPDEWSLLVINQNELDELKLLELYSISKVLEDKK